MNVAIYARKSTEQNGVADEQKSVARQVEHARQYAASKGWTTQVRSDRCRGAARGDAEWQHSARRSENSWLVCDSMWKWCLPKNDARPASKNALTVSSPAHAS